MKTRFALRAATDDLHRELDTRLSRLNLSEPADYRQFLKFQARSLPPIEDALAAAGLGTVVAGWSERRRTHAIEADLASLGEAMPPRAAAPAIAGIAELLGTAYVVEGSRLGARVLHRQVGDGLPAAFLSGDGSLGPWPALLDAMESRLDSGLLVEDAEGAACRCFAWFLDAAGETGIQ